MKRTIALLFLASGSCYLSPFPASAIVIDTVPVGNLGNVNDPATGGLYGGVAYAYRIGKYEVTVGQYSEFLNAVARTDAYNLYNPLMATSLHIAGIAREGMAPNYSYNVIGSPNHPIAYVSWADAARFANWMHNGQPFGPQTNGTTETGAYTMNGAITNAEVSAISRSTGAAWFIPSENEWYKAAYHQPAAQGGDADNYWNFPTRSNSVPNSDQPPGAPGIQSNVANYFRNDFIANGYNDGYAVTGTTSLSFLQNHLTDVGAFLHTTSPYGAFDMAGNVWEWNEALILGTNRGIRGGSWSNNGFLDASVRPTGVGPQDDNNGWGFRLATVPEPGSLILATLASACGFLEFLRRVRIDAGERRRTVRADLDG